MVDFCSEGFTTFQWVIQYRLIENLYQYQIIRVYRFYTFVLSIQSFCAFLYFCLCIFISIYILP